MLFWFILKLTLKRISCKIWCFKWSHGHCHNLIFDFFPLYFLKKLSHKFLFLVIFFKEIFQKSLTSPVDPRKEWEMFYVRKYRALLQQVVSRFQLQLSIQATRLISSWKKIFPVCCVSSFDSASPSFHFCFVPLCCVRTCASHWVTWYSLTYFMRPQLMTGSFNLTINHGINSIFLSLSCDRAASVTIGWRWINFFSSLLLCELLSETAQDFIASSSRLASNAFKRYCGSVNCHVLWQFQ